MKKNILIITLSFILSGMLRAQISFEHEFSQLSAASVNLPTLGYKYYAMDAINNQCIIYNTDYTIFKQVSIPVPSGTYLVDLQYVSENLFDTDPLLEFLYVIYKYDSVLGYGMYSTRIMNETGTQLLQVDGGGYSIVYPAEKGSKLFVWIYDFSVSLYSVGTRVYGLPGTYGSNSGNGIENNSDALHPWPNPASKNVMLPLPPATAQGKLTVSLFNQEGKLIEVKHPTTEGNLINLPITGLAPGLYYYRITRNENVVGSGKLLIAK